MIKAIVQYRYTYDNGSFVTVGYISLYYNKDVVSEYEIVEDAKTLARKRHTQTENIIDHSFMIFKVGKAES